MGLKGSIDYLDTGGTAIHGSNSICSVYCYRYVCSRWPVRLHYDGLTPDNLSRDAKGLQRRLVLAYDSEVAPEPTVVRSIEARVQHRSSRLSPALQWSNFHRTLPIHEP
jgi:hypothetical protein